MKDLRDATEVIVKMFVCLAIYVAVLFLVWLVLGFSGVLCRLDMC